MQRFKLDLSLDQFVAVARGEVVDIKGVKFESYDAPEEFVKYHGVSKAPVVARKPRRTKAQIEADNAKSQHRTESTEHFSGDANQPLFPWKDDSMNDRAT